ncbi:ABC transporter ATP-binding protein [Salinicola endophyticus]|uniref:ABC transporter ATP-binding protein n=1 Tax=Salinicola endophyticus TaxID=1949083 RepID=UPI000DA1EDF9|nr:ABC transporter ATP-binding protein [Salinicola endophyticus]
MIEIQNLYKRYHGPFGGGWVLKDVNIIIPDGVSVGVVGKNGAGKSTLLRLIGGMDVPDRGRVVRRGRVSWPIGLAGGFKGSMTGRQNVKFVARIHGIKKSVASLIKEVESFAEIGKAFDDPVNTYSSGMRSRLAFGLSLAFDFDIYISDEATAVGDRAFKAKAREAFQKRIDHASLIMVSHGEGSLRQMCEAGIFVNEGSATWYDKIDDAITAYHQSSGLVTDVADEDDDYDLEDDFALPTDLASVDEQLKSLRRESAKIYKRQIIVDYLLESESSPSSKRDLEAERVTLKRNRREVKRRHHALRSLKAELDEK